MSASKKNILAFSALALILMLGGIASVFINDTRRTISSEKVISVAGSVVSVTIADTAQKREVGLSGRTGLGSNEGMLFSFPTPGMYAFWMKDMLFPVDIIWIAKDGKIGTIFEHVSPATYPEVFNPFRPAQFVLEVKEGFVHEHEIMLGDTVTF